MELTRSYAYMNNNTYWSPCSSLVFQYPIRNLIPTFQHFFKCLLRGNETKDERYYIFTHRDFHVESVSDEFFNLVQLLLLQVNGYEQQQLTIRTVSITCSTCTCTYAYRIHLIAYCSNIHAYTAYLLNSGSFSNSHFSQCTTAVSHTSILYINIGTLYTD